MDEKRKVELFDNLVDWIYSKLINDENVIEFEKEFATALCECGFSEEEVRWEVDFIEMKPNEVDELLNKLYGKDYTI